MNQPAVDMAGLVRLLLGTSTTLLIVDETFRLVAQYGQPIAGAIVEEPDGSHTVDLVALTLGPDRSRVAEMIESARASGDWAIAATMRIKGAGDSPRLVGVTIDDLRSVIGSEGLGIRIQDLTEQELRARLLKSHARIVSALGHCPPSELNAEIGRQLELSARPTITDCVELSLTASSGKGRRWTWTPRKGVVREDLPRSSFSAGKSRETPERFPATIWRRSATPSGAASAWLSLTVPPTSSPMPASIDAAGCDTAIQISEAWGSGMRTTMTVGTTTNNDDANIDLAIDWVSWIHQAFQQGLLRLGAEAVTTAERHRSEVIFSQLSDFVLVWAPDGRLTFATPSFAKAVGVKHSEITGLRIEDLVLGGVDAFERAVALDHGATGSVEQWVLKSDPNRRIVIEAVTTNLCDDEHLSGYLTAARDITHRILQSERATRRDSLSAVVASISSRFVNATTASTSANIRRALSDISKACPVERVLVWQRDPDGKLRVTHEHTAPGVAPLGRSAPALDIAQLPELLTTALDGQPELCVSHGHGNAFIRATEADVAKRLGAILVVGLRGDDGHTGLLTFSAAYDDAGNIPGLVELMASDTRTTLQTVGELFASVINRAAAQEALTYNASHDALTGLANRRLLLDRAERMLKTSHRRGNGLGLLFLDLDDFKTVNDTLGHDAGDEMLKDVGDRLRRLAVGSTVVARLGGDEFVMLVESPDPHRSVTRLASQITNELSKLFLIRGRQISARVSIGAVVVPLGSTHDHQPGDLVRRADMAMYQAKGRGGNSFEVFSEGLEERVRRKFNLHEELREAIGSDQLELWYQPQVKLSSSEIIGCEALVRWRHPVKGFVLPNEFIGVAEQAGLIGDLGNWVFRQAAQTAQILIASKLVSDDFTIAVNVSPLQLVDDELVPRFTSIASEMGVAPSRLTIELTESTLAERDRVIPNLEALRRAGFRTSIDDFGTGFSSLSYLRDLPLDELKIDRTFVKSLSENRRDLDMVWALVEMAHSLGLEVVAEGVETEAQRNLLANMGCNMGQGWLFAKAMPRTDLMTMLSSVIEDTLTPSAAAS